MIPTPERWILYITCSSFVTCPWQLGGYVKLCHWRGSMQCRCWCHTPESRQWFVGSYSFGRVNSVSTNRFDNVGHEYSPHSWKILHVNKCGVHHREGWSSCLTVVMESKLGKTSLNHFLARNFDIVNSSWDANGFWEGLKIKRKLVWFGWEIEGDYAICGYASSRIPKILQEVVVVCRIY